jgi:hypothetical protein
MHSTEKTAERQKKRSERHEENDNHLLTYMCAAGAEVPVPDAVAGRKLPLRLQTHAPLCHSGAHSEGADVMARRYARPCEEEEEEKMGENTCKYEGKPIQNIRFSGLTC